MGHLESAAGSVGFFKCIRILLTRRVPPNIHLSLLNPHLEVYAFPVQLPREIVMKTHKQVAGVSSFGAGGTNAHSIIGPRTAPAARNTEAPRIGGGSKERIVV